MQQTSERKQNKMQNNKGGFSMFNKMKHMKNEKGLTLIELLAVIVILAIIAAIAIPSIGNITKNQNDKAILAELSNAIATAEIAHLDGICDAVDTECTSAELVEAGFTQSKADVTKITGLPNSPSITFALTRFQGTKYKPTGSTLTKGQLIKLLNDGN